MPEVKTAYLCEQCGTEFERDNGDAECPKCGHWVHDQTRSLICEVCGEVVMLFDSLTNECDCGALYNGCGQRLAPEEEWDERDRPTYDAED